MKKKILKSLFAIACLLSSTNALAYDFEVDGIYYDVVSFSDLTCKVTTGDVEYQGDIVIPATTNYVNKTLAVVGIVDKTFKNCSGLTSITIPNTISSIGNEMFNGCYSLWNIVIEDGETTLKLGYNKADWWQGYGLFYDCPITNLYVGRNLSYDNSNTTGSSPFYDKTQLTNLTIGNYVTRITSYEFSGCSGLTSLAIPNNVTDIGHSAFSGCSSLISVTIPSSVTNIGSGIFASCSGLTSVTIPSSVTSISDHAFYGCSNLLSISIPSSVTHIGKYAFENCSSLTSVVIPNSVTTICYSAFAGCSELTNVTIGKSVTSIEPYAFDGCDKLNTLYSLNITPPSLNSGGYSGDTFTNNHYMTLNVFVPQEALTAYQRAEIWNNFWNMQGFDPTGIGNVKAEGKGNYLYHDLKGNRFNAPKRGVNIINGKKVVVK